MKALTKFRPSPFVYTAWAFGHMLNDDAISTKIFAHIGPVKQKCFSVKLQLKDL